MPNAPKNDAVKTGIMIEQIDPLSDAFRIKRRGSSVAPLAPSKRNVLMQPSYDELVQEVARLKGQNIALQDEVKTATDYAEMFEKMLAEQEYDAGEMEEVSEFLESLGLLNHVMLRRYTMGDRMEMRDLLAPIIGII